MPKYFTTTFAIQFVALCVLLVAHPLWADVQYSNLGSGDSFNSGIGSNITGPQAPRSFGPQSVADEFTAAFTEPMTSVDVAIFGVGGVQSVTLVLYANNPLTSLPAVSSMLTLGNVVSAASGSQLERLTLSTPVPLVAGVNYWLGMLPATVSTYAGWNQANNSAANPDAYSQDGGATFVAGSVATAFRINSDLVPEPSTWALLLAGAAALVGLRHRSRPQFLV